MIINGTFPYRRRRLYIALYLFYLACVALFLFVSFQMEKRHLMESVDTQLLIVAQSLKHMLAEDFHDRAVEEDSISFAEEMVNRWKINRFAQETGFIYIYTLVEKDGKFYFSAPTVTDEEAEERKSWYFYPYDDVPPEFCEAIERQETRFVSYRDQWGYFRSVAHPEISPGGHVYLACADLKIDDFQRLLWQNSLFNFTTGFLFLLMSVPFVLLYRRDNRYLKVLNCELSRRGTELEGMVEERTLDLRQALQDRIRAEKEFRQLFNDAVVGIFRMDATGRLVLANPRLAKLLGYASPQELLTDTDFDESIFLCFGMGDLPSKGLKSNGLCYKEMEVRKKNGENLWVSLSSRKEMDSAGRLLYLEGFVTDVTERKRYEEEIQRMALEDHLTGLPNRKSFLDALHRSIKANHRNPRFSFAVLMIDLDDFKQVNDNWGHLFGDRVLIETSRRMKEAVRANDTLARLGGDEFAVLLEDIHDIEDVSDVASRIIKKVSHPLLIDDKVVRIGVSIGAVIKSEKHLDADAILQDADNAMYRAKNSGKNQMRLEQWNAVTPS